MSSTLKIACTCLCHLSGQLGIMCTHTTVCLHYSVRLDTCILKHEQQLIVTRSNIWWPQTLVWLVVNLDFLLPVPAGPQAVLEGEYFSREVYYKDQKLCFGKTYITVVNSAQKVRSLTAQLQSLSRLLHELKRTDAWKNWVLLCIWRLVVFPPFKREPTACSLLSYTVCSACQGCINFVNNHKPALLFLSHILNNKVEV